MSAKPDAIPEAKVVLLGTTMVGKTSIVTRVTSGEFDPSIKPTIGACYASKSFDVNGKTVKLQIWDTAGQERFKTLVPMYYRGAKVAVIVFSVVDAASLNEIDFWATGVKAGASPAPLLFVIGNKIDLVDERTVTEEQGQEVAKKHGAEYFEISATTGTNIDKMIARVAEVALAQVKDEQPQTSVVTIKAEKNKKKGCC
ncbi:small GTP-binding protein [Tritrichomonas foetus]|uniref:Small GTP-binding protein n=1 Tax=Tritrichomonas foetus TaxID=1144522 RepID=A0A1J4K8I2_9EUKA|nr:small GTP-binding protein [Tritrichomonas foetus]|eukprot:OHT06020.1 small GTP-binding protein [Tritrichomonas foetus]